MTMQSASLSEIFSPREPFLVYEKMVFAVYLSCEF